MPLPGIDQTFILKLALASLPAGSVNTYVTTVVPRLKYEFGGFVLAVNVAVPELSEAVGSRQ